MSVCWFLHPLRIELGPCCEGVRCSVTDAAKLFLALKTPYVTVLWIPEDTALALREVERKAESCGKEVAARLIIQNASSSCSWNVTFSYICSYCLPCRAFLISLLIIYMLSLLY